ncbi:MAG TPA: DoxX family protein [Pyrinomonadaceae bacterium]|nr:DoxX family protein [Pyrinomonadaceae bacterium]
MDSFLGRYSGYIYAIFRIVFGFLFMLHGTQKVLGWPAKLPNPCQCPAPPVASDLMQLLGTMSGPIELALGILILVGLFGRVAAFLASGTMAVAYFMAHQPQGALPIMNGGETAVLYCFAFLYIAANGSGMLSVDGMLKGSRAASSDI